jgi:hypothetical protein
MQVAVAVAVVLVVVALQPTEAVKELVQDRLHLQELPILAVAVAVEHTSTVLQQATSVATAVQVSSSLGIQVKGR